MKMLYIMEFTYAPLLGERDMHELLYVSGPASERLIVPNEVIDYCSDRIIAMRKTFNLGLEHPISIRLVEKHRLVDVSDVDGPPIVNLGVTRD